MMYYAKQVEKNGDIISVQSMSVPFPVEAVDFIPITEAEYLELMAAFESEETDEISDSEALAIITGGTV